MSLIQLHNATIGKVTTLSDKTLKVDLYLRELPVGQMAELMNAYMEGKEGFEIKDTADGGKTPSQRLKNVIYKHWEQNTDRSVDSEIYYRSQMNKIINAFKDKLN
jgi:hypothetical protein